RVRQARSRGRRRGCLPRCRTPPRSRPDGHPHARHEGDRGRAKAEGGRAHGRDPRGRTHLLDDEGRPRAVSRRRLRRLPREADPGPGIPRPGPEAPGVSTIFDSVRNPLVRAVARIPLPIRAKQLVGSLVIAALLALVAVLGLVALGQSNSRGTELRRLQQQGVYEQLLLTDATQLKQLLDYRRGPGSNERPLRTDEPDLQPTFDPASYQRGYLS